jgi:hypothetical protein
MNLLTTSYLGQSSRWPQPGRHILAQFDETSILVYLQKYARQWIVDIEDISDYVAAQRECSGLDQLEKLVTPTEDVYPVADEEVATRLQVSRSEG